MPATVHPPREITVHWPERRAAAVTFRWTVDPPTPLYRRCAFTLCFPPEVDVESVPDRLWWTIALLCLHAHWPLLRPCTVRVPVRLAIEEIEFWSRLLDAAVATLEAYGGGRGPEREILIQCGDEPLPPLRSVPESARCAMAFSGGKDSLLQAGLLTEFTRDPALVTITSPMPPLEDHLTERRRHVLREITRRRAVTLIEVETDYRSGWENAFPQTLGYPIAVNELCDTFLYFGALLATGAALRIPHLFLASEAEVQENVRRQGRVIQHPHFMYSSVTQRAVQALLRPAGYRYGSLTVPLHSAQVQELLWTRYRGLRDLQYSCWRVRDGEAACSRCSQCFRIALSALALGESPGPMGVDLVRVINAMREWKPREPAADALPGAAVSAALGMQMVRDIQRTPVWVVARVIGTPPWRVAAPRAAAAVLRYAALRHRLRRYRPGAAPGYRRDCLRLIDPMLRDAVTRIYDARFPEEPPSGYAAVFERADALTAWITEPIGGEAGNAKTPAIARTGVSH